MTTLLDTASPAINANVLKDNGLTGEGVTIAVIDTGIHPHEDLQDRIIGFKDFVNRKLIPMMTTVMELIVLEMRLAMACYRMDNIKLQHPKLI